MPLEVPPTTICFVTWYRHMGGPEIGKTGIIHTASKLQGQPHSNRCQNRELG